MILVEKRYQKILQLMQDDGSVKVSTLKEKLDVSSETIRRDLEYMESQGLLKRTYGGALLIKDKNEAILENSLYTSFNQREMENIESKIEVAELAVQFIEDGQVIALDSGTTSLALARSIKNKFKTLTVVTNSLIIANELAEADGITLVLTGGVYKADEAAFISDIAESFFSKLSIETFFLTTCGISVEKGVTYQRMDEISIQEKMMEASDKIFVITDSSKLGVNSLVKMCDVSRVSMIITDSYAKDEQIKPFREKGIKIIKPTK